jgi:glycosyltransferase involved in cell wall biosynthesis
MVAFACNPAGNGEHWLGWGWAEQAASFCEVTLLTWDRFAKEIEPRAQALGIKSVCVGAREWVNRIGDRSVGGRWFRQLVWHRKAAAIAARMHSSQKFEIVHQTTFHTFRIPMLAARWEGCQRVWGPIAGGESCPPGFGPWLGRLRTLEASRGFMNRAALARPSVRRSLRVANSIFVSNHTTLNFFPEWCRERCMIVSPNAVRDDLPPARVRKPDAGGPLKLLFVGNCVATRSIPLVLEALGRRRDWPWSLTVVGGGAALADWKQDAARLNLTEKVTFTGLLPRAEVARHYAEADAFVFPALRDSGGSGVLEAMSSGLPVVCFDWGGPAEMVDAQSGIKVSVANPEASITGLAAAFERLRAEPAWRSSLGQAAARRAREEFSWHKKRELLEATYADCLGGRR